MERFGKRIVLEFSKQGRLRELLRIISSKTQAKKLYNYTNILIGKSNWKMDTIWAFLSRIRPFFFQFQKIAGGLAPLTTQVTDLWVWMNVHKYFWIIPNILENACIMFFAITLNIPGALTCSTSSWRCLGFWTCQSSEYGTVLYGRVTQSSEYIWIWLNVPEYASICLNVPEFT